MRRTTSEIATDSRRPIDCLRCFRRMTLKCTEPRPLGYELRIFECLRCDVEHQIFVADPIAGHELDRQQSQGARLMPRPSKTAPLEFADWETRAAKMAAEANRIPPGPKRDEAMRKAKQLIDAAEIRRLLMPSKQA